MTFRDLLKTKRITQVEIARIMGVRQSAVSAWVCGKSLPTMNKCKRLAKVLGVSVKTLVESFEDK